MKRLLAISLFVMLFFSGCTEQKTVFFTTFEIVPSEGAKCNYENENFTVTIIKEDKEILDWEKPVLNFTISPESIDDYTAEDYVTIFFKVKFDDPNLFSNAQGVYQIEWRHANDIWKVEGSKQFNVMKQLNLSLELNLNLRQVFEEETSNAEIIFHDKDHYWEKTYNLKILGIEI